MNSRTTFSAMIALVLCYIATPALATQYLYDDQGNIRMIVDSQGAKRVVDQSMFAIPSASASPDAQTERSPKQPTDQDRTARSSNINSPISGPSRMVNETIDTMRINAYNGAYSPYLPIDLFFSGFQYDLSNGSMFSNGSSSITRGKVLISSVNVTGNQVEYSFAQFGSDPFLDFYDFGSNNINSAEGRLELSGSPTMLATLDSNIAVLSGALLIRENVAETVPSSTFTRFSASEGAVVPFSVTVTLTDGSTWNETTFDNSISYQTSNMEINFNQPISTPVVESISVGGTAQIPPNSNVGFNATIFYEGGFQTTGTDLVQWSVEPAGLVTIENNGVITTSDAGPEDVVLTISAQFQGFSAQTETLLISEDTFQLAGTNDWSTYQGNAGHTGYVPVQLEDSDFPIKWETSLQSVNTFNQVAVSGDTVFATAFASNGTPQLYAIDSKNGQTLWSKSFGSVDDVFAPATAYGNVYVHVREPFNSNLDAFYAFNGETGAMIFSKSLQSSFSDFEAPLIRDGFVYVPTRSSSSIGSGRMVKFDAFTGQDVWEAQVRMDEYRSPTIIGSRVLVHTDSFFQGIDNETGELIYSLQEPAYDNSTSFYGRTVVQVDDTSAVAVFGENLVKINLQSPPQIEWTIDEEFRSEVSVAEGVAYVATSEELHAYDVDDGSLLWSYSPDFGGLGRNIVVTETHLFITRSSDTLVIDLGTRNLAALIQSRNGSLALGNEHLYISGNNGRLTAVELSAIIEAPIVNVEVVGPIQVAEFSVANYQLSVTYADGTVRDRTALASFSSKPSEVATLSGSGTLSVGTLTSPQMPFSVNAQYSEEGVTLSNSLAVELFTSLTNSDFSVRSLDDALAIEQSILFQLEDVRRALETARNGVIDEMSGDAQSALMEIDQAILRRQESFDQLQQSRQSIENAIDILTGETPTRSNK